MLVMISEIFSVKSSKNYRPVNVLPGVSKIPERLMHKQISFYIDQFLSLYMCGYRKSFSTQHALLSLSAAILMDLSKSLDTINRDLLIAKLHVYGFSKESLKTNKLNR